MSSKGGFEMAQNLKDMTLAQLEKANQELSAQRAAIKVQQLEINAVISKKLLEQTATRPAPSQVVSPPSVASAEEIGKP
jgi:hypothetical protein